jgi:hypothetical protein
MMDDATINLWMDQAERDGVISPGFRPQVERMLLDLKFERDMWISQCNEMAAELAVLRLTKGGCP